MSSQLRKILPSIILSWLIFTSVLPISYLQNIPLAKAASFTVTGTTDAIDAGACETVTAGDMPGGDGVSTLREYICVANNTVGTDSIVFADALGTIVLSSNLPTITETLNITGGNDIVINGSAGGITTLLNIQANSCSIKGLEMYSNGIVLTTNTNSNTIGGSGANEQNYIYSAGTATSIVYISGSSNTLYNNYIGITKADAAAGGSWSGIQVAGASNIIGGSNAGERNFISDNESSNISLESGSTGTKIKNNYIGTNTAGTSALGTNARGIQISNASNIVIGPEAEGELGNVISGNTTGAGIYIDSGTNTQIYGNLIGTDKNGTTGIANLNGIAMNSGASTVTIGGAQAYQRNIISAGNAGITIPNNNPTVTIKGNYIGTDINGTADLGNGTGILIAAGSSATVTIGGTNAGEGNTISGNNDSGLNIQNSNITIIGNKIGTNAAGTGAIANGRGIKFTNYNSTAVVGSASQPNIISGNSTNGIEITGATTSVVPDITISGNYIGTDITGSLAVGNGTQGILLDASATSPDITIGDSSSASATNVISGNSGDGISVGTACRIYSSYIGTNLAGTEAIANGMKGIDITASNVTVGNASLTTGANVISGNTDSGIILTSGINNTVISGNYIGTDKNGTSVLANSVGISINTIGSGNIIGTASSASPTNIISGNTWMGMQIGNTEDLAIYSSLIGTNATGTAALANGTLGGILLETSGFTIGANSLTTGFNVISGNSGTGIYISGASASGTISGNIIGMNLAGSSKIANTGAGIDIQTASTSNLEIGDYASATATNVISGNTSNGINIQSTNNVSIYSSIIGADKTQTAATTIGNGSIGIKVSSSNAVRIGNTRTSGWNVVANNTGAGISIKSGNSSTIKGNFISTDQTATYDLGNTQEGIAIGMGISGTIIGGITGEEGNIIKNSDSYGISVAGTPQEEIRGNLIYLNGTPSDPIQINTPGTWNLSGGLDFTTNTTSKVEGTISGITNGTTIDIYSGTSGTNPALMNYEGSTPLVEGNFRLEKDFTAVAGNYFYAIAVDTTSPKTTEASSPSGVITQDSTPPTDLTLTSPITARNDENYTFTGTKESYANVENNGTTWVAKENSGSTWSYPVVLTEGANTFNLCSEDYSGNRSATGTYTIALDTITPSAPTLSYITPISSATTIIHVTGEVGTRIFVNGVNSGESIAIDGTKNITVSITAGVTNTFSIVLRDEALNVSSTTIATIVGGNPPAYGGGGGSVGGINTPGTEITTTTPTTTTTTVVTDETTEEEGTDEMAGEEETTEENFEQLQEPTTTPETTTEIETIEPTTTETTTVIETVKPTETKPVIQTEVTEEQIDEQTFLITYQEPGETVDGNALIMEVKLDTENKPEGDKGLNINSLATTGTGEETLNTFVEQINNLAEEKEIDIKVKNVLEQVFEDEDNDGMPKVWEDKYLGDEEITGTVDTDSDGLTNLEEFLYGSDPFNKDTDNDGLSDGIELLGLGTNPGTWDTDGDGISDTKEVFFGTSATEKDKPAEIDAEKYPEYADSDQDGISDYVEEELGTDPLNADSDNDGSTDIQEVEDDTNPNSANISTGHGHKKTKATNIKDGDILSSSKTLLKGTSTPNTKILVNILDANKKPISVIEAEVDTNGKFAVTMDAGLADGTYSMFIIGTDEKGKNAEDISPISTFTIDSTKAISGVTIAELDDSDYVKDGAKMKTSKPKIKAFSAPHSRIYVTWKSFIFSSVLMADTETGEFIVEAPADLESGDHTAYLYALDETTGVQGEVMMVNFTVAGENLASETTGIPGEESNSSGIYLYLLILPILGLGAAYIFYKKSKEEKKAEKSLIDKLENKQ